MSLNSSSTNNSSVQFVLFNCVSATRSLISAFNITRGFLFIPLSIFILYLGFQQWKQHRSFKASSHSDIFTYNQAFMQLIWGLGATLATLGIYINHTKTITDGNLFSSIVYFGEIFFQIITCLERYLAVVHPVTYRVLQKSHGVKIRNVGIVFSWLVSWIWACLITLYFYTIPVVPFLSFLMVSFLIILFCNISVLCALIRRGPGEGHRNKGQVDQIKQRAFFYRLCNIWDGRFVVYCVSCFNCHEGRESAYSKCQLYDGFVYDMV